MAVYQIGDLSTIPQAPADADVLAIEVGGVTYKVSKSVLASAILAQLGGDPVTVAHGGTGATNAEDARENLGVPSNQEMEDAIQQSTANIKIINHGTVNLGQVAPKTRGAVTVTFATPFTDTNYSVVATFAAGSQGFAYTIPQIQSKTKTTVSIGVWNNDANTTATVSALDWVAVGT